MKPAKMEQCTSVHKHLQFIINTKVQNIKKTINQENLNPAHPSYHRVKPKYYFNIIHDFLQSLLNVSPPQRTMQCFM